MGLNGKLQFAGLTDPGRVRDHNEDHVFWDDALGLVIVADGMGGYNAGEVASEIAVTTVAGWVRERLPDIVGEPEDPFTGLAAATALLEAAIQEANAVIHHAAETQPQCAGMGTTLVMGLFTNNRLLVGHIGDSRMYRLRDDEFTQLTEDHSLLQEQLNSGLITAEQAKTSANKNLVTRALGVDPHADLELHEYDVEVGDIYLLCSDGLNDLVEDEEIHTALQKLNTNLELAAHQLIEMANDNGGKDKISVLLVRVLKPFTAEHGWYDNFLNWLK